MMWSGGGGGGDKAAGRGGLWFARGACRGLLCNALGAVMVMVVTTGGSRTKPQGVGLFGPSIFSY